MRRFALLRSHQPLFASIGITLLLAYGGGFWLHTLHGSTHQSTLAQWLRDSTTLLPLILPAVLLAQLLADRLQRHSALGGWDAALRPMLTALFASAAAAAAAPLMAIGLSAVAGPQADPAALFVCSLVGVSDAQTLPTLDAITQDGMLLLFAHLLLAAVWYGLAPVLGSAARALRRASHYVARMRRTALAGIPTLAVLLSPLSASLMPSASAAPALCEAGSFQRSYDVAAINVAIPYNRWGDRDPNGMMYVLEEDRAAVENWFRPLSPSPASDPAGNRRLRPRPLVLRANEGECIQINFTNRLQDRQWGGTYLNPRASMHIMGLAYNAQTSDGGRVGYNADTTIGQGETISYYWLAPNKEGLYNIRDTAAVTGSEADGGSGAHGLFGALVVEPAGSTWLDGASGLPLYSGTRGLSGDLYLEAIIQPPGKPAFREAVQLGQDEIPEIGLGFNYGSEPQHNRDEIRCPDCVGEETSLSSWTYGDPALVKLASGLGPWRPTWQLPDGHPDKENPENCGIGTPGFNAASCYTSNVIHGYRWDRYKLRYSLAMTYETHIFHLHANQWRTQDKDPNSTIIDSQTWGPGDAYTADLLGGAGSFPGTVGDSIFHCHLYPHFADGFWALLRVHDTLENGASVNPDGLRVAPVEPLPSGNLRSYTPPPATAANPGFPRFIPGTFGWRAPQPIDGISEQRPENQDPPTENDVLDDPTTIVREDLVPGMRMVAGQALDPSLLSAAPQQLTPAQQEMRAKLLLEQQAMQAISGGRSKPGAPYTDPCPTGAREITYNVSIIQTQVVYNESGWYDSQARFLILDRDVEDVMAGVKEAEPFFMRVNQGDCINLNLTNRLPNWFGNDAFVKLAQTNMMGGHIHLVKFDVMASDGSSNGWNYQEAAFTQAQMNFKNDVLAGLQPCDANEDTGACRIPMPDSDGYNPLHNGLWPGQTLHERWYADTELRTIFTHDHHFAAIDQNRGQFGALIVEPTGMDMRHPNSGTFFQPINNAANGTPCGAACNGSASGTRMDIIGPGPNDDFREYGLAIQDFVSLTRPDGDPANAEDAINAPETPELFPKADPGTMSVNYRNAPLQERRTKNGVPIDPAYVFSSYVWGDPKTPLLEAYSGDPVQFRVIQGSQEEQHSFQIHGLRWRQEPADPTSPLVGSVPIGISEAFNLKLPQMSCGWDEDCRGDYLYSTAATDDLYNGVWGIFRVYGRNKSGLLPLPDTQPQDMNGNVRFNPTGSPPPMATNPGTPCMPGAPVRKFTVVAHDAKIVYNEYGYHDPYGLLYTNVRAGETVEQAMARARLTPEPMVLRANEGDCIEVTLHNRVSQSWLTNHGALGVRDGDAPMPTEPFEGTPGGLRVSLHPQLLSYDVRGSDGATVGYNRDQTVAPGASYTYRWYAEDVTPGELGALNLLEYGDVRGHRHHGMSAGMVIGPRNATYHDPLTGRAVTDGAFVDVRVPGQPDFRDLTVFYQDGLNLRKPDGSFVPEPTTLLPPEPGAALEVPEGGPANPLHPLNEGSDENAGEKAFNYGTEPLNERLGRVAEGATQADPVTGRELADLFSSVVYGDPATPILRAYAGDPVRLRVLQTGDRPRQHTFQISGHAWADDPFDPNARWVGAQGGMSVARAMNIHLPAAGGAIELPGDFRYGSAERTFFESRGLWGIFRVYPRPTAGGYFAPSALAAQDNPYAPNYHPIMPLEMTEISAVVYADSNQSATRGVGEGGVAGVPVKLRDLTGAVVATATTGADGAVSFQAPQGVYTIEREIPADWAATSPLSLQADTRSENASILFSFGMVQLGDIAVRVYNDRDADGAQATDGSEIALQNWTVRLTRGGAMQSALSGPDGRAIFTNLVPGSYQVSVVPSAGWDPLRVQPLSLSLGANGSLTTSVGFGLRGGISVQLYNDSNGNGAQDVGESPLAGWPIHAVGGPSEMPPDASTLRTNTLGIAAVTDAEGGSALLPGLYTLSVAPAQGWACNSIAVQTRNPDGAVTTAPLPCGQSIATELLSSSTQVVTIAFRNPNRWVTGEAFNDINRNGLRDASEGKLVGWTAQLYDATGSQLIGSGVTGNDGKYTWAIATDGNFAPLSYKVRFIAPTGSSIPWDRTGPEFTTLTIPAGEKRSVVSGFIQLSSVSVAAFHDHDQDGVWDSFEGPLAGRNIILYAANGTTVVGTAVTDANGRAAIRTSAGTTYQVEAALPSTSWLRTTPKNTSGVAVQKIKFAAPTNNASYEIIFGQYDTVDITPPPSPSASIAGGTFGEAIQIGFESETGATFKYTVDGSTPSASNGYAVVDPTITLAAPGTTTLKVVAFDKKGNVSAVLTGDYTIAYPAGVTPATAPFSASPLSWKVSYGGVQSGLVDALYARGDGKNLTLRTIKIGSSWYTDGYASTTLPTAQRAVTGMAVDLTYHSTGVGTTHRVWLYNVATGQWEEQVATSLMPTVAQSRTLNVAGDPQRFVSAGGEVRARIDTENAARTYTVVIDQIVVRTQYQP